MKGNQPQSGFTLLETLLALSLSAVLLGAIYAAIDQSWRMSASGREEMERAQLARALIHKIEIDIRAITFVPPPPVEEPESTSSSTSSSTSTPSTTSNTKSSSKPGNSTSSTSSSTADTTDTEELPPNSKSIGIRGNNQKMEMSIARPRRDLLPGTATNVARGRTSDLRAVTYSFLPPGSSTGSGLVRIEGDRMAVEMIEANGSSATQISNVQMLAPEVASFLIRYFDGRIWSIIWDSEKNGRIPRAVEVSFTFPPVRRKPGFFKTAVGRSMDSFRTVILIPVSDPYPKEFLP